MKENSEKPSCNGRLIDMEEWKRTHPPNVEVMSETLSQCYPVEQEPIKDHLPAEVIMEYRSMLGHR